MKTSTGRPATATVPASGRCRPDRIDINVDLPAPFSPITAVTTPARTSIVTSSSATTPGKCLLSPAMLIAGLSGASVIPRA